MRSQDIEIPEPCHADWDAMRPEDRGRFCFDCKKKVHDLSAMTEPEARQFLDHNACNDICVSYEHESDGGLVFRVPQPRPAPIVPISRLRRPRTAAAAVAGMGIAAALAACAPHGDGPPRTYEAEAVSFQTPTEIIPHRPTISHEPTQEAEPPPPVVEDEPCETEEPEVVPDRPRVRGRIKRTAGKPVMRKKGKKMPSSDPFAL